MRATTFPRLYLDLQGEIENKKSAIGKPLSSCHSVRNFGPSQSFWWLCIPVATSLTALASTRAAFTVSWSDPTSGSRAPGPSPKRGKWGFSVGDPVNKAAIRRL